ncbi:LysR substrate-binding domain-containing protein [Sneathiella marina]|uniref:LysR substrate-binding domain-containing protein n=1 Tax=Sneathiella marina TaxID=2950108 RepID=A0ABY4W1R1_9PROT|nr:LysR family transcriptional regulator [Sneathiella marina]USG60907.1 LysR substrate-binding domain-containing protein [Sneathiella marina]
MDLKHLKAFDAVARHLHFTKAAQEQRITQPTLSLLIQQLEDSVGVKLLVRSTREVSLTEMGAEFLPRARKIVVDLDRTMAHMRDLASLKKGKVTVATFPSVAANQLPRIIVDYRREFPDITVQIHDGIFESIIDKVREGAADFAIASSQDELQGLKFEQLYDDEILLIAAKDHRFARHEVVRWLDIGDEEIVMLSSDTGTRQRIDRDLADHGITVNTILEPALVPTAAALVAAGAGLGVILSSYLPVIDTSNIVTLPLIEPTIRRPVGLITRPDRVLSPAAEEMRIRVVTELAKFPDWMD